MTTRKLVAGLVAVALAAVACGPAASSSVPPSATAAPSVSQPSASASASPAANAELEQLIADAKAEGELVLALGSTIVTNEGPVFQHFADKYGLKLTIVTGVPAETVSRILAEREQGIFSVDATLLGGNATGLMLDAKAYSELEPQLFLPEVLDRSTGWRIDKTTWNSNDTEKKFCITYVMQAGSNYMPLWYNTENVTEADVAAINSWDDLIDPKWAGRWVLGNLAAGEVSANRTTGWLGLGEAWFDKFVREMKPEILQVDTARQIADGIARGTWDFSFTIDDDETFVSAQEAGLPIAPWPKTMSEGTLSGPDGNLCVLDKPAHPAAIKLFANWLLSKEGQTAYNEYTTLFENIAQRNDVPQGKVPDDVWERLNAPGLVVIDDESVFKAADDESLAWWKAIFTELGITPGG